MSELLRTVLVFIAIPLFGVFVPAILTWLRDFSAPARRIRRLEEQGKIVAFWDSWLKADALFSPSDTKGGKRRELAMTALAFEGQRELYRAGRNALAIYQEDTYRMLDNFPLTYEQFQEYRAGLPWYRRAFLLYKAPNPMARWAKIAMLTGVVTGLIFTRALRRYFPFQAIHSIATQHHAIYMLGYIAYILFGLGLLYAARAYLTLWENSPSYYPRNEVNLRNRHWGA